MSKIRHIFKKIAKFFDKKIITPITKSLLWIFEKTNKNGKGFEKILSQRGSLVLISLLVALTLFFFVDTKSIMLLETSADVIYNQEVIAIYNEEAYVIEGLPETVDITLIGRKSDLYLAKQLPSHDVTVDLKGLKPGTHKVSLKHKGAIDTITYKLDPSVATITIYSKVSEVRSVNVDILNEDKLDPKLSVSMINVDKNDVIIKGSQDKLNEVAIVKALVDVNNLSDVGVGTLELTDIPLIAYNQSGQVIDIEIVPSKINAEIIIESPKKVVPIKIVPVGQPAFGKALKTIETSVDSVTIYGDQETLNKITYVPVEVDVTGISENRSVSSTIKKPSGVRYISENNTNISITLDEEITVEIPDVQIEHINLGDEYIPYAFSQSDIAATVIVKGVSSVIDELDPTTIRAYVDLKGYGVGQHEVEVVVEGTDLRLTYIPKVKKVNIVVSEKN